MKRYTQQVIQADRGTRPLNSSVSQIKFMDLDIDNRKLGFFVLGQSLDLPDQAMEGPGYTIYIRKKIVAGFVISFSESTVPFESEIRFDNKTYRTITNLKTEAFEYKIFKDNMRIFIGKDTSPEEIARIFRVPNDSWDDSVEVGLMFDLADCSFEFIWRSAEKNRKKLAYMAMDIVLLNG